MQPATKLIASTFFFSSFLFFLVTILCWITIVYITFWECYFYMKTTWKEEIFVDVSAGSKLSINLDIVVSQLSCDCENWQSTFMIQFDMLRHHASCMCSVAANVAFLIVRFVLLVNHTDLSLDAVDSSGDQHLQIDYNIFKRRLDLNGRPIEEPKKECSCL